MMSNKTSTVKNLLFVLLTSSGLLLAGNASAEGISGGASVGVQGSGDVGRAGAPGSIRSFDGAGSVGANGNVNGGGLSPQTPQDLRDGTREIEGTPEFEGATQRQEQRSERATDREENAGSRIDSRNEAVEGKN